MIKNNINNNNTFLLLLLLLLLLVVISKFYLVLRGSFSSPRYRFKMLTYW